MRKYALIFCFLNILFFSKEISDEQFNRYYDYAVLLLRGLSGKDKPTDQLCGKYLQNNKESLLPVFKEIIEKVQNNTFDYKEYLLILLTVNSYCDLLSFYGIYLNFQQNVESYVNKTLKAIGQSLSNVIDFSVD